MCIVKGWFTVHLRQETMIETLSFLVNAFVSQIHSLNAALRFFSGLHRLLYCFVKSKYFSLLMHAFCEW